MNKVRRKQIEDIKERIAGMLSEAEEIISDIESIRDDEQEYRDNMPESLANGEKGEKANAAIEALDEVIEYLQAMSENDFDNLLDVAAE